MTANNAEYQRLRYPLAPVLLEELAAAFHEVYQAEARRQAALKADKVRHPDNYNDLPEHTKDYDRALVIYVLDHIGWFALQWQNCVAMQEAARHTRPEGAAK